MKRIKFFAIAVIVSAVFTSCSSDDSMLPLEQKNELLKTYKLKRDASGAYSVDLNIDSNVKVNSVKDATTNTTELYLNLTDDNFTQKSNLQSGLFFDDENFKVDFISENSNKVPSISVFDDNVTYVQKSDTSFLKEFSITKNENGTYELDFKVIDNVSVDFVYNENINAYEIHLEANLKSQGNLNFSRTLEKESDKLLQIHFVNHLNESAKGAAESTKRKPIIIIDEGEDL